MVRIYSIHFNRPDFIELQYQTLKHFVQDEHEFIVINNGQGKFLKENKDACERINVKCIPIHDPDHSLAGLSHQHAMMQTWNEHLHPDTDIAVFLDFDIFFIDKVSIKDMLNGHQMAGLAQSKEHIHYLWPGLLFLDLKSLPDFRSLDFRGDCIDGHHVDSGGRMHFYLKQHNISIKYLIADHLSRGHLNNGVVEYYVNLNPVPERIRRLYDPGFCIQLMGEKFLHFGRGSNWDYMAEHYMSNKNKFLKEMIRICIEERSIYKS